MGEILIDLRAQGAFIKIIMGQLDDRLVASCYKLRLALKSSNKSS
jgi:hypothetical protein